MITQTILNMIAALWQFVVGLLEQLIPSAPGWWVGTFGNGLFTGIGGAIAYVMFFFPLTLAAGLLVWRWSLPLIASSVRWLRRGVSLFTGGGGSAG